MVPEAPPKETRHGLLPTVEHTIIGVGDGACDGWLPAQLVSNVDPKSLVSSYFEEVLDQGRIERLNELLDPNFRSYGPAGTIDRAGYHAAVAATLAAFSDLAVTVEEQIAERDLVATRWTAVGTHTGAFFGIEPTRRKVRVGAMHMHRVESGRLVEHWEVIDLHGLLAQLRGPANATEHDDD